MKVKKNPKSNTQLKTIRLTRHNDKTLEIKPDANTNAEDLPTPANIKQPQSNHQNRTNYKKRSEIIISA